MKMKRSSNSRKPQKDQKKIKKSLARDKKCKNSNESEIGKALHVAKNGDSDTIIDNSLLILNDSDGKVKGKNNKISLLFIEVLVSICVAWVVVTCIYFCIRHHLRKVKTDRTISKYKQQCREKSIEPLLIDYKEDYEFNFRNNENYYKIFFEESDDEELDTAEFLGYSTTKRDVKAEICEESYLDFHGENLIGSDLIRLQSPLKSKENISEICNSRNKPGNVEKESYENMTSNPESPLKSEKVKTHSLHKADSKLEQYLRDLKQCQVSRMVVNQSSVQAENTLNFLNESKELLDFEIKSESGNYQQLTEETGKHGVIQSSIQLVNASESEDQPKKLLDINVKSENENRQSLPEKDLSFQNSRYSSKERKYLLPELEKSYLLAAENDFAYLTEDKDENNSVTDLMSSIWSRTFVVQQNEFDDDQSSLVKLLSSNKHSKIIQKSPKRKKSNIPTWKGKSHLKLYGDMKNIVKF